MRALTIYSDDFDEKDEISEGFSGRVFLDPGTGENVSGVAFGNISEAMKYLVETKIEVDEIMFCYLDETKGQMFKKFKVSS